ncbi:GNAT family N-acetyltransferase [Piscinibacter terrae]|uniref:GNAT family N-acetyltransferase n=1 Tax=Piscinibacter terrae TaxID=2496871 RepID=A0A3N7JMA6_9BURK|nr:GNAT family N-acetyltransferase [Albitalea terrae]RQP22389.1 GNAT family N-acetyltransferase [Albitalea terrae]
MNPAPRIAPERADQPDVVALIEALDAYQKPMYPAESHHGVDIATLMQPNVLFVVARDEHGSAVGCAGLMLADGYGEIKRMYVDPASRGRGLGRALLDALEAMALARGCTLLRLETGPKQPEALRTYERQGFVRRGPFADYWDDPHSVFMEKALVG